MCVPPYGTWCNASQPAPGFDCDPRTYQCKPAASGGTFPSRSKCEAACGITCPAFSQRIGDRCYAVMDKMMKSVGQFGPGTSCAAFPNCTQDCQLGWLELPSGWQVANGSAEVAASMWSQVPYQPPPHLQAGYAWGTDYLVYGDGTCSATWSSKANWECNNIEHLSGTNYYRVSDCNYNGKKVVMSIPAIGASRPVF